MPCSASDHAVRDALCGEDSLWLLRWGWPRRRLEHSCLEPVRLFRSQRSSGFLIPSSETDGDVCGVAQVAGRAGRSDSGGANTLGVCQNLIRFCNAQKGNNFGPCISDLGSSAQDLLTV